uniref:Transposon protein, putative, CACTA, En/Spm sub-class n=1 Tax=Oryza sativa subsp. japonica TaxID=39947 RepID=Q7XDD3_ORYSJ|nr:transposon protein, putative, CACTA, En/Spm sub-class [Oryza sativa Japonica Group]
MILADEETDEEMFFRGPTRMPPRPTRDEDKPVLTPKRDRQWQANDFGGNIRVPTGILTVLIKHFFPGIVKFKGRDEPAWSWKHYRIAPDDPESAVLNRLPSRLHRVEEDFWLYFRWAEGTEQAARKVVRNCIKRLFSHLIYETRILAVLNYQRNILKVEPWWFLKAKNEWRELIRLKWCNPEWQASSHAHRIRREKMTWPSHRQGSANLSRFQKNLLCASMLKHVADHAQQIMEKKKRRIVSQMEAYTEGRGEFGEDGRFRCNTHVTGKLEAYNEAYVQLHGAGSDWRNSPIDPMAVHMAGGGKKHGRFMIGDGLIDSSAIFGDSSLDDPHLERQLQEEREAREREREEREREKERERQEREQEKERECEERAREKEQDRKERELERKERELEKIAFEQKSSFFEVALRALSVSSALNGNSFCADHGGVAIVSGAI